MTFCGISVLTAEMPNKSCYTSIEIYPGELRMPPGRCMASSAVNRLNSLTCIIKCLLKHRKFAVLIAARGLIGHFTQMDMFIYLNTYRICYIDNWLCMLITNNN